MLIRMIAVLFGILFIFIGVAGFVPMLNPNGYLFGFFEVGLILNIIHIVSGVIAILASARLSYAKFYFLIFGILYTFIAIIGFYLDGNLLMMHVNKADNFLHLVIGIVSIYLGYYANKLEQRV